MYTYIHRTCRRARKLFSVHSLCPVPLSILSTLSALSGAWKSDPLGNCFDGGLHVVLLYRTPFVIMPASDSPAKFVRSVKHASVSSSGNKLAIVLSTCLRVEHEQWYPERRLYIDLKKNTHTHTHMRPTDLLEGIGMSAQATAYACQSCFCLWQLLVQPAIIFLHM